MVSTAEVNEFNHGWLPTVKRPHCKSNGMHPRQCFLCKTPIEDNEHFSACCHSLQHLLLDNLTVNMAKLQHSFNATRCCTILFSLQSHRVHWTPTACLTHQWSIHLHIFCCQSKLLSGGTTHFKDGSPKQLFSTKRSASATNTHKPWEWAGNGASNQFTCCGGLFTRCGRTNASASMDEGQ